MLIKPFHDPYAVRHDGTTDLTGDWTISTNSITLTTGTITAEQITSTDDLDIADKLNLTDTTNASDGVIYKGATAFLHNFHHPSGGGALPDGNNVWLGGAGNFTTGSTATEIYHASRNVGIGYNALIANTTGYRNFALGDTALYANTSGRDNMAIGVAALLANASGVENVGIGYNALGAAVTSYNVAIGANALKTAAGTSEKNLAIGATAGFNLLTGNENCLIGYRTGYGGANWTGNYNVAIGPSAMQAITSGGSNTVVGRSAAFSLNSGSWDTLIGIGAGYSITSGDYHTMVGRSAGFLTTTQDNDVFLGAYAGYRQTTSWRFVLDSSGAARANAAAEQSTALMYGWFDDDAAYTGPALRINNQVGIGLDPVDGVALTAGASTFGDGGTTNYAAISATGDLVFYGSGGLSFAEIYTTDASDTITIAVTGKANKVQITSFTADGVSNNMTPDHTNDHITVVKAGMYLCTVSIHAVSTGGGGADNFGYSVYKNNGATEFPNLHGQRDLTGGGGDEGSMTLSGIIDLAVNDTIEVWIWNNTNADDVVIDDINLSLVQVGGT